MKERKSFGKEFYFLIIKILFISALIPFIYRAIDSFLVFNDYRFLLLAIGECISAIIFLFSKTPKSYSLNFFTITSTLAGTFYLFFVQLDNRGFPLINSSLSEGIQIVGILVSIFAKLSLGFSFGIFPENKGIVTRGLYKIVRHPMYLGYLISHIGYLLSNLSIQNFLVYSGMYFFQFLRISYEEKLLSQDQEYVVYRTQVRFKIIPFVF